MICLLVLVFGLTLLLVVVAVVGYWQLAVGGCFANVIVVAAAAA